MKEAERHFKASVKTMKDWLDIQNALDNYIGEIHREHTGPEFIRHGSTWFNNWREDIGYKGPVIPPPPKPQPKLIEAPPPDMSEDDLKKMHDDKKAQIGCRVKQCAYCAKVEA